MLGRHPEPGLKEVVIDCVRHFSRGTFGGYLAGQLSGEAAPPDGAVEDAASAQAEGQPLGEEEQPDVVMLHAAAGDDAEQMFVALGSVDDDVEDEAVLIEPGLGFDDP